MKAIHWVTFKKDNIKQTIFEGFDPNDLELDYDYLEEWFAQKPPASFV